MICIKQMKIKNGMEMKTSFPCGNCTPCKLTRLQEWTCRLLLEAKLNLWTYYITLTYSETDLPYTGDLHKSDLQDFLKRLRKNTQCKLRYFAVGEYGDKKGRPHYHLLIFTNREFILKTRYNTKKKKHICIDSDFHQAWLTNSFVDVDSLIGSKSHRYVSQYVSGYVLKKLSKSELERDKNRVKPFILSSRGRTAGGGIGGEYAKIIANRLKKHRIGLPGTDGISFTKDLFMIKIDGKKYPLGRYMRDQIYKELGGDNRPRWVRKLAQHQKTIDREIPQDEQTALETESSNRASKSYQKYLKNRKLA